MPWNDIANFINREPRVGTDVFAENLRGEEFPHWRILVECEPRLPSDTRPAQELGVILRPKKVVPEAAQLVFGEKRAVTVVRDKHRTPSTHWLTCDEFPTGNRSERKPLELTR